MVLHRESRHATIASVRRRPWAIWHATRPIGGTLAESYLRQRNILINLPPTLRFHPDLKHGPSGRWLPAMVSAVQGPDRRILAIHRTFLEPSGCKAQVERPKMLLASPGTGAVRLGAARRRLGLAEGVEILAGRAQEHLQDHDSATPRSTWACSIFMPLGPESGSVASMHEPLVIHVGIRWSHCYHASSNGA